MTVAGVVDRITGPRELVLRGEDAIQPGPNRLLVVLTAHVPDVPGRSGPPGRPTLIATQIGVAGA